MTLIKTWIDYIVLGLVKLINKIHHGVQRYQAETCLFPSFRFVKKVQNMKKSFNTKNNNNQEVFIWEINKRKNVINCL